MNLGRRRQAPWKRNLPCLATSGKTADGRRSLDQFWLEHFGQLEFGQVVDAHDFFKQIEFTDADEHFQPELCAMPTMAEVEQAFRGTKCKKAPVPDLIYGETLPRAL